MFSQRLGKIVLGLMGVVLWLPTHSFAELGPVGSSQFANAQIERLALDRERREAQSRARQLEEQAAGLREEAMAILADPTKSAVRGPDFRAERRKAVFRLDPQASVGADDKPVFMSYERAALPVIVRHLKEVRIPWIETYGTLASRIQGDSAGGGELAQFDTVLGTLFFRDALTTIRSGSDYEKEVEEHGKRAGLNPRALNAAKLHLSSDSKIVEARTFLANQGGRIGSLKTDGTFDPTPTNHKVVVQHPFIPGEEKTALVTDLDGVFGNDVLESARATEEALNEVVGKLGQAQRLSNQASAERANAPQGTGTPAPGQPQNAGNGGAKEKNGSGGGTAGLVPGPGGLGDVTRAIAQPGGGDLVSVSEASRLVPTDGPKFEGLPNNAVVLPPLRSTAGFPVSPTSGTPARTAATNFIAGNMGPGTPIDWSRFAGGGAGGDNGGGDKPASFGGNPTGGVSGGAFGGDDVGRGIGPAYEGRSGLEKAVKFFEAGPGGGSTTSETSGATILTGSEAGLSPALAAQMVTGKPIRAGAAKGALGLMGQVHSLLQTQCGDKIQRSKFESFCANAGSVAAKAAPPESERSSAPIAYGDRKVDRALASTEVK